MSSKPATDPEITKETKEEEANEHSHLVPGATRKSGLASIDFKNLEWTWKDFHLTLLKTLITFGDAAEIYLPGVITQAASDELKVSQTQEGFLGIILYLFLALSYFILPAIKDKVGRKEALKAALYISIIATVFCCSVPNYWTLLVSRAVLGFCIGLNMSMAGAYFAEEVSNYTMYNVGTLCSIFTFTLGGGWIAILGYFLLSRIGWRFFILTTSAPLFLPPIIIIDCVLTDKSEEKAVHSPPEKNTAVINVNGFWCRLIKASVLNFINTFQGWGSILLIPALLANLDKRKHDLTQDQELLILALLYGLAKLLGRILSIFLLKCSSSRILQPLLSAVIASCYLTLILQPDQGLTTTIIAMGIANMCFCVTRSELTLMEFDSHYFGTERLVLAGAVMSGCGMLGAAVGAIIAQFLTIYNALIFTFVLSCIQVVTFSCITER